MSFSFLLKTPRLTLRELTLEDAESMFKYRTIPSVSKFQGWIPQSTQEVTSLIESNQSAELLSDDRWFQIGITQTDTLTELIGDIAIKRDSETGRQVEIGITLIPEYQNFGYAREALEATIDHLFNEHPFHRIHCSIDPLNKPSIKLFEKLGFRKEAHHVKSLWFKGSWADDVVMAMLQEEWFAR